MGLLEAAFAQRCGSGERSFFMAEQFTFDHAFRQGCAVELMNGPIELGLLKWIALATSSLPTPLSPRISTVVLDLVIFSMRL